MSKEELIIELIHLLIGDRLPYSEDRSRLKEIQSERDQHWIDLADKNKEYKQKILTLRQILKDASNFLDSISRFPNDERMLISGIFLGGHHLKDQLSERVLGYIAIEHAIRDNSNDYVSYLKRLLIHLGYPMGLVDEKLRDLSIIKLLDKLLDQL